jgi:hypothetical protein
MSIQVSHNEQKPDVYDVLMGGKSGFDRTETPLMNRLEKGPDSPNAALFQYPFDVSDEPSNDGSAQAGRYTQAAADTLGSPDMLYGRMQYEKQFFGVGEVTQEDEGYAVANEDPFLRQMRLALRKLMKSGELIIVGNQEAQAGSNAAAYKTRGLERIIWNTANIANQTDTATVIPAAFRPAAAQVDEVAVTGDDYAFEESDLVAIANALYSAADASVDMMVACTIKFKGKVSSWGNLQKDVSNYTQVRRFNHSAADMKITATIDTWSGDAGNFRFFLNPLLRRNTTNQKAEALFLDEKYVKLRVRHQPKAMRLPEAGAGHEGVASMMFGVQALPKYLAKVYRDS